MRRTYSYAAVTKDAAQRRRWTFYEAVKEKFMKERLQERLQHLKNEFATGQQKLAEMGAARAQLQETMLRISGAIQALEELLAEEESSSLSSVPVASQGR